jgi:hypothetical protein
MGFRVQGLGFGVSGSGFRVQGLGFKGSSILGFRVEGFRWFYNPGFRHFGGLGCSVQTFSGLGLGI